MGAIKDWKLKSQITECVRPISNASSVDAGHIVAAFRHARPIAAGVVQEIVSSRSSLSGVYVASEQRVLAAAQAIILAADAVEGTCVVNGDVLISFNEDVMNHALGTVNTAYEHAMQ